MADKPKNDPTPETPESAEPVATSDVSLLNEDALAVYNWISKAVREATALSVGAESETDTLVRIFESAEDKSTKSDILALVSKARENVPDEETVKSGLAKAKQKYDAGITAWSQEETPDGFVLPTLPESMKKSGNATGRGAGVPRPRGLRAATKEFGLADLKSEKGYLTSATLAQKIGDGVSTKMLVDAWREFAGENSDDWQNGQTTTVDVKGKEKVHSVTFLYIK